MNETPLAFWDKLLPNQREFSKLYAGTDLERRLYETICRASGLSPQLAEFDLEQSERFSQQELGSNPVTLRFLQLLIAMNGTRTVLEIGAFIGASAMAIARFLPADGSVVTIEKFGEFAAIARRNFARNGLATKIRLIEGDAFEVLRDLPRDAPFDLVFIDGNKERYLDYFRMAETLLAPRGLIVIDDCFFHGDALNAAPSGAKGAGCKAFLDHVASRDDYLRLALPLANGLYLMRRR